MEEHEDVDVWSNFEKSVTYMKQVTALYESTFGCKGGGPSSSRKTVTKAHLDEAYNQAQQALELLASNLLNASMTIVSSIEKQVSGRDVENEADQLKHKVKTVRQTIRDRQAVLDHEALSKFYSAHNPRHTRTSLQTTPQNPSQFESELPQCMLSSLLGGLIWC
ncbi:hypothetical protein PHMEG_0004685 [Phytophthora megakarya]|uniref:Uncharacterized protein n=1 Tax=Phytophthora megakarya TaxID=4795 RepID=A0A225WT88_9STRA|nr:hypothetical protein PHMEG_0004685 [Phytophthora megakarya]